MAYEILIYEYVDFDTYDFKQHFDKAQSVLVKDGVTITDIQPKNIDFDKQFAILTSVNTHNMFIFDEDETPTQGCIEVECINQVTKNGQGERIPELTFSANDYLQHSRKVLNADLLTDKQFAFIANQYRQTARTWSGIDFNYSIQFAMGYMALTPNAYAEYLIPGEALLYEDVKAIHDYIVAYDILVRDYDDLYAVWNALNIEPKVMTLLDYKNINHPPLNELLQK